MKTEKKIYILYVFFLVVAAAAVLELGARWRYTKSYLAVNIHKDPVYHHRIPPYFKGTMQSDGDFNDTFVVNNKGMRGPGDYEVSKLEGVFRIAVLGDSFTFGVGVKAEETYAYLLQKMLNAPQPGKYQVLNFGVSSFSPVLELICLKREVVHYQPDLLIVALDLCDIQDDYFYEPHVLYDRYREVDACNPFRTHEGLDLWAWIKQKSVCLTMLDEKLFQSFRKIKTIGPAAYLRNKIKGVRNKTEILTNPNIDNIEFDRFIFSRENKNRSIVTAHWKRTAGHLAMIKGFCDRHSIKLLLTTYPYGHQVGPHEWDKGRRYWAFEPGRVYDASAAFKTVEIFSRENSIPFISLLEPLKRHPDEKLYYHNDGHWTARGHEVVAESLFQSEVFKKLARS